MLARQKKRLGKIAGRKNFLIQPYFFVPLLLLGACATYNDQTKNTFAAAKTGNIEAALADLEKNNSSSKKELLYYLEKGEIQRLKGADTDSRDVWLKADALVHEWEETAKYSPSKLMGELGAVLVNDQQLPYYGRDYEKVMLSVRLAMNHLALQDWEKARVEIKKMHERESVIAEFREKELTAAKAKSAEKHLAATSFKELNGYPVETLNDPAVRGLKNSYESAFANYLAGFIYESQGEVSLAAPGYRKASEMQPNIPLVDAALAGLDRRAAAAKASKTSDTLVVIETGEAPMVISRQVPIPIPTPKGLQITAVSWPVINPDNGTTKPINVRIDGKSESFAILTEVNPMARRAISDEMPGIIARTSIRAISRAATQYAIDDANSRQTGNAALIGALFSAASKIATVATEVADTRIWRTLPGYYGVARANLAPGPHTLSVDTPSGSFEKQFTVSNGPYSVVEFRSYGPNSYAVPALPPQATAPSAPMSSPVAIAPLARVTKIVSN